jgi:hypothetical protein
MIKCEGMAWLNGGYEAQKEDCGLSGDDAHRRSRHTGVARGM